MGGGLEGPQVQKLCSHGVGVYHLPSIYMVSAAQKLSEPHILGIYMGTSSYRYGELLTPLLTSLPSLEEVDSGSTESFKLHLMAWSFRWGLSGPIQKLSRSSPKVTSLEQSHSYHLGNSKRFGGSGSGTRIKEQVLEQTPSALITHEITEVSGPLYQEL